MTCGTPKFKIETKQNEPQDELPKWYHSRAARSIMQIPDTKRWPTRRSAMRSVFKAALIWGAVGFAMAVFFFVLSLLTDVLADVELVFWPSSFAFMALDNSTATRLDRVEGTAFLIFTNFVLYFVVGFVLTLGWKTMRKMSARHHAASQSE